MKLPLPLTLIIKEVADDLPQAERTAFIDVVNAAAEGKNLDGIHWHLLKAELRALPKLMPKDIQSLVDQLIEGLNRIAVTKWWDDIFTTFDKIEILFCKEWVSIASHVQSAIYALKNIMEAVGTEDEDLEYDDAVCTAAVAVTNVADAAYHAAYDASYDVKKRLAAKADEAFDKFAIQEATRKATAAYAEARQRQQNTLLLLIESAPSAKDREQ